MARRTCEDVEDGISLETTELGAGMDWEEGRRSGYVFTEPRTSMPDDLELSLLVLIVALLVASIASFDFFAGCDAVLDAIYRLDFELRSGMSGMVSRGGTGSLGTRGDGELS
jgi:hypothetical protein